MNGLAALRHVEVAQEAGQDTVTTQLLLMEGEIVRGQVMSQECVIRMRVQVQPFIFLSLTLSGQKVFQILAFF